MRGKRDLGRGNSRDEGLEVGMGLVCFWGWKGLEEFGGGERGGGRRRMNWRSRRGLDYVEFYGLGCIEWFILRIVEIIRRF